MTRALVALLLGLSLAACDAPTEPREVTQAGFVTAEPAGDTSGGAGASVSKDDPEEIESARAAFEEAADELRSAVQGLSYLEWQTQMHVIRSKLDEAEEAVEELERVSPNDTAVGDARDEIDRMRSHMARLYSENWRHVAPDLTRSASDIEDAAGSVTVPETSDEDKEE